MPPKTKKNPKVGFGSAQERFKKFHQHPKLDTQGMFKKVFRGMEPALYYPKLPRCQESKNQPEPWAYKQALEDWSKHLGYRNDKILRARAEQKAKLGPAWHSIESFPKPGSRRNNIGFSVGPRFKTRDKNLPPVGHYYKAIPFKLTHGPHTKTESFDWSPPCRFPSRVPSWSIAPDRYNIIDKESIEEKPNKLVSLKGPYQLFSGKRDPSSIKNHFGEGIKCFASTFPLALPGSFEKLKKSRVGVFNKTNRNVPSRGRNTITDQNMVKSPDLPGPSHYVIIDKRYQFKENKYGFNSSDILPRGYKKNGIWPAIGKYNLLKLKYCIEGRGHCHVFESTIQRTIGSYPPKPMNAF